MRFAHRTSMALAVASLFTSCTTGATQWPGPSVQFSAGTLLTAEEMTGVAQSGSLLDALQRLRPLWLNSHKAATGVSMDGAPPVELAFLRDIPASTVREVRFERGTSSVSRSRITPTGDAIVGDMIFVTTRRGGGGH